MKVSDICESISKTFPNNQEYVVFLNTSDVLNGKILHSNYSVVKDLPGQAKKTFNKYDILYSEIRPKNRRFAFIDFNKTNDYVISTKLMVIRCIKDIVIPKYLFYFLTSDTIINHLQEVAESRSGTFPQITFEEIKSLDISLPSLTIQQHIVNTIGSIDDFIENLTTTNHKINAIIQSIFNKYTTNLDKIRIGDLLGYQIIKSGIEDFKGNKVYLDTASVDENGISSNDYAITMADKPSRANMQPISNSIWFAKLKDSPKYLFVKSYMIDILDNYIFSTGFLGIKADTDLIANFLYALVTSYDFDTNKNRLSIGATMQGINNESFKEILVPDVSIEEMKLFGGKIDSLIEIIYNNKCTINKLNILKQQYLNKFFR